MLATARGTAVRAMEEAGILSSRGGKVALHSKDELPADWSPETDTRVPVWEATMHLVRAHDEHGIDAAGDLLRRLPGGAGGVHDLAYRLYTICDRKGWSSLALWFNGLVTSWPDIERSAQRAPAEQQLTMGEQ